MTDQLRRAVETHDPDWVCAGISDEAIEAGMEVFRQVDRDNENYVAGETTDWDEGMIVGAIFKAVGRALLADQAWLDARDAEFDDRWNARMNP